MKRVLIGLALAVMAMVGTAGTSSAQVYGQVPMCHPVAGALNVDGYAPAQYIAVVANVDTVPIRLAQGDVLASPVGTCPAVGAMAAPMSVTAYVPAYAPAQVYAVPAPVYTVPTAVQTFSVPVQVTPLHHHGHRWNR